MYICILFNLKPRPQRVQEGLGRCIRWNCNQNFTIDLVLIYGHQTRNTIETIFFALTIPNPRTYSTPQSWQNVAALRCRLNWSMQEPFQSVSTTNLVPPHTPADLLFHLHQLMDPRNLTFVALATHLLPFPSLLSSPHFSPPSLLPSLPPSFLPSVLRSLLPFLPSSFILSFLRSFLPSLISFFFCWSLFLFDAYAYVTKSGNDIVLEIEGLAQGTSPFSWCHFRPIWMRSKKSHWMVSPCYLFVIKAWIKKDHDGCHVSNGTKQHGWLQKTQRYLAGIIISSKDEK